jgi:hypothetical protein
MHQHLMEWAARARVAPEVTRKMLQIHTGAWTGKLNPFQVVEQCEKAGREFGLEWEEVRVLMKGIGTVITKAWAKSGRKPEKVKPGKVTKDEKMTYVTCSDDARAILGAFTELVEGVPREDHQRAVREMIRLFLRALRIGTTMAECVQEVQPISQAHQLSDDEARALVQMIFRRVETIRKALDLNPDLNAELKALTAQRNRKPNPPKGVSHE